MIELANCFLAIVLFCICSSFLIQWCHSVSLRYDVKKEDLIKLLIIALRKSADTITFSLIIFVGVSEIWEAFFVSKSKIYFPVPWIYLGGFCIWLLLLKLDKWHFLQENKNMNTGESWESLLHLRKNCLVLPMSLFQFWLGQSFHLS